MLRLERLEIHGFKSFAEKTRVEFPDGVTAVVGPNGCGKSNVADAVMWALGEQSAKALRGSSMEDVIFNGTDGRSPGGVAEVTLHLVAEPGVSLGGTERSRVSMTRRLYRTGESEYLLDGKRARLTDIRALLDEVRAGVRTYAIIDQGRVGSFVISKPKERRVFIEEAAGIASYKARRRKAELKLEATTANLLRVEDIVAEVERQRRSLQRQASLARRARRIDEEYRALKSFWTARRHDELGRRLTTFREALGVAQSETRHLEAERARVETRLAEARVRVDETRGARERLQEERHACRLEEERVERDIAAAEARAKTLEEEAGRREGEDRQLVASREARLEESVVRRRELEGLEERLGLLDGQLEAARQRAEEARAAYRSAHELAGEREKQLYDQLHERSEISSKLSAAREAAVREEHRASEAEASGSRLRAASESARSAVVESEEALGEAERRVAATEEAVREAQQAEEAAGEQLERRRSADAEISAELGQRAGEKAALDSLDVRLAGAEGARQLLEHAEAGRVEARHVVADVLDADQEVERAAESYLEELLPAVVLGSDEEILKASRLGIRGALELIAADAPPVERPVEPWPEALAAHPRVRGRLSQRLRGLGVDGEALLGRADDAVLVDDLETALALYRRFPDRPYLTAEGHIVRANGLVVLRAADGEAAEEGLLARTRRRDALAREVAALEERRMVAREALESARDALVAARAVRREREEEQAEARRGVATALMGLEQAQREVARLERESEAAAKAHERALEGLESARRRTKELDEALVEADERLASAREALESARVDAQGRDEAMREATSALAHLESERRAQGERRSSLAAEVERMARELGDLEERRRLGAEAREKALADSAREAERALALRERLREVGAERSAVEERLAESERALAAENAAARETERRLTLVGGELEGARGRREAAALEAERADSDLGHLAETCREELGVEPEALPREPAEGVDPELVSSEARLAEHIGALRAKRARLGPVNLLAEQEFDELSQRWEELTAQRDDLRSSIDELKSSISRMNRESRDRFLAAYNEIRRHFREQFALLFRGGRADLVLEDPEDPLETGIEIICQPPGKKLQGVTLLSGGEKALAATAVLFAIFRYHPPPFCLLDEVDAPLDDTNVGRFAEALRGFAAKTQFILITHNKRTMELADLLYGVTMPEPGVSRLVSMTLD